MNQTTQDLTKKKKKGLAMFLLKLEWSSQSDGRDKDGNQSFRNSLCPGPVEGRSF